MPFVALDTSVLRRAVFDPRHPPAPVLSMNPVTRGYLTLVTLDVVHDEPGLCVYALTHPEPVTPAEVTEAVAAYNADPAAEWRRLVSEALDAEEDILLEDRCRLDERAQDIRDTRARLIDRA